MYVKFKAPPPNPALPQYGFDAYEHPSQQRHYEQIVLEEVPYFVPWKSVATGRTDQVLALLSGDTSRFEQVQWKGVMQTTPGLKDGQLQLTVQGTGHEEESEVLAYRKEGEEEVPLGKLNVISYDQEYRKLYLVSVNGTSYPYNYPSLQDSLNRIFSQAVVRWELGPLQSLEVPEVDFVNGSFDDGSSGLLSNYTPDMRKVVRAFRKAKPHFDKDALYIFLVRNSASDKEGFMPRKQRYGFLFADQFSSQSGFVKTLAHELGHGAFRLKHSFEQYPEDRENLMDYAERGTRLRKYQWDLVHDPVAVWGLFEKDEEGELVSEYKYKELDLASEVDIHKYISGEEITYITPGGELITLSKEAKPSFTGVTHVPEIDTQVSKGTLLAFREGSMLWRSRYRIPKDLGSWEFMGYVNAAGDYYPGAS
ncbi:hypothetical protein, partial [Rapidithrix thailandica]|uniref:hypothetical protein n=1 Tax=Rapidithrix thailandica TaxID=413964 RepID=UPI0032172E76